MYMQVQREDVVRIPPERLGEGIDTVAKELTRTTLEGKVGADKTLTLVASNIEAVGEGRIVVLGGGGGVEQGTHDELMARESHYYRLYQAQARNVDTDLDDLPALESEPTPPAPKP